MTDKRKTAGGYARCGTMYGYITHQTQDGTRRWFTPFGVAESIMFTPRSDGAHRAFPGPADGPRLVYIDKASVPEEIRDKGLTVVD